MAVRTQTTIDEDIRRGTKRVGGLGKLFADFRAKIVGRSVRFAYPANIGSSGLRACGEPTNTELVPQAAPPHVRMYLY